MSCRHTPIVKIKHLFARNPEYICRDCNARIELKGAFKIAIRVINALFLMIVVYRAFKGSGGDGTIEGFLISMAIIIAMAVGYILLMYLITRYGPYEEIEEELEIDETPDSEMTKDADITSQSLLSGKDETIENQDYTEEQQQLMEMYAAYEKQALEREAAQNEIVQKENKPVSEPSVCKHVIVKSWKNYIPSKIDFTCQKCGEKITFSASRRRSMNLVFLAVMVIILMPSFSDFGMKFWKYSLLTLLALAVATLFQIYFVKKWPMEIKK